MKEIQTSTDDPLYKLKKTYLRFRDKEFCPVYVERKPTYAHQQSEKEYALTMWSRQGDCCYERHMTDKNGPIVAAIFRNIQVEKVQESTKEKKRRSSADQNLFTQSSQSDSPVNIFVYVPALKDNVNKNETDYFVHIVILNRDRSLTKEYRIKDWSGIFSKTNEIQYNIGITGQGVLVISNEETLYYLCLKKDWVDPASLKGRQIPRNSKLDFWVHDIPYVNFEQQNFGSKCVSELGLKIENIYEQYNSSTEADKLIAIVSKSQVSDKKANQTTHQSFFGFFELEWEESTFTIQLRQDIRVQQKIINVEEQQKRCSDARNQDRNMSYIKKLDHIGIFDETTSERMHYIIAQFSNNTLDLYCNKILVNSIYDGKIKVPYTSYQEYKDKVEKGVIKVDFDDKIEKEKKIMQSYKEYRERMKKTQSSTLAKHESKIITVNDFEIDDKRIYLIKNQAKDEGFSGAPDQSKVDLYYIDLKLRARIGRDFILLKNNMNQGQLRNWMSSILEDKVREFYKPCTKFIDFGGNFVFAHRNIISLYSTLVNKWSHLHANADELGLSENQVQAQQDEQLKVKIVFEVIPHQKTGKNHAANKQVKLEERFLVALFDNGRVARLKTKKWESLTSSGSSFIRKRSNVGLTEQNGSSSSQREEYYSEESLASESDAQDAQENEAEYLKTIGNIQESQGKLHKFDQDFERFSIQLEGELHDFAQDIVHRKLHIVRTKTDITKVEKPSQMKIAMRRKLFQNKEAAPVDREQFKSKLYVIRYVDDKTKIVNDQSKQFENWSVFNQQETFDLSKIDVILPVFQGEQIKKLQNATLYAFIELQVSEFDTKNVKFKVTIVSFQTISSNKKNVLQVTPVSCFKIPALSLSEMNLLECHSIVLITHPDTQLVKQFIMFDDSNIYDFGFDLPVPKTVPEREVPSNTIPKEPDSTRHAVIKQMKGNFAEQLGGIIKQEVPLQKLTKSIIHMNMNIRGIEVVKNFIYTSHTVPKFKNAPDFIKSKEGVERKITTDKDIKSLVNNNGIGIIDLRAYIESQSSRPCIVPLAKSLSGVNSEIFHSKQNRSLIYMDSFSSFKFMPLPHLNTLPLHKQKPRSAYLITQKLDNFFVALECDRSCFKAWHMTTGQEVRREMDLISGSLQKNFQDKKLHMKDQVSDETKNQLANFKVWSGCSIKFEQDPASAAYSKGIQSKFDNSEQGSIKNQPKIYLQNQLDYTILWRKGETDKSVFLKKDYTQLKVTDKLSEFTLLVVSLELEEVDYEKRIVPKVKVHFQLKWRAVSDTDTDLFFAPWTDSSKKIKMLEITNNSYIVHTFKKSIATPGEPSYLEHQVDATKIITGFPREFVGDNFSALRLLSRDFKYYIDWGHYCENYIIRKVKTGNEVYTLQDGMYKLRHKNNEYIKTQMKYINWVDDHHIYLTDIFDKDNICQVIQVIKCDELGYQGQVKSAGTIPYLQQFQNFQNSMQYYNYFQKQIFLRMEDTQSRYMFKHGQLQHYLKCQRSFENLEFLKKTKLQGPDKAVKHRYCPLEQSQFYLRNKEKEDSLRKKGKKLDQVTQTKMDSWKEQRVETLTQLNNILFSIDCYTMKEYDVIELPFTTYDWNLLHVLESYWREKEHDENTQRQFSEDKDGFLKVDEKPVKYVGYISYLLKERVQELLLMILPHGESLLNFSVRRKNLHFIKALLEANEDNIDTTAGTVEVPFNRNFEGITPLHISLDEKVHKQLEFSNYFIKILSQQNLDHHSKAIQDVLSDCIENRLTNFPHYLSTRVINSSFFKQFRNREGIQMKKRTSNWHSQITLRENIDNITNLETVFKKDVNSLVYLEFLIFDLPEINCLHVDTPADDFYNSIDRFDDSERDTRYWEELVNVEGVKSLINIRWDKIQKVAMYKLFWPYVAYIWMFQVYCFNFGSINQDSQYVFILLWTSRISLTILSIYFIIQEARQWYSRFRVASSEWVTHVIHIISNMLVFWVIWSKTKVKVKCKEFGEVGYDENCVELESADYFIQVISYLLIAYRNFTFFLFFFRVSTKFVLVLLTAINDLKMFFIFLAMLFISFVCPFVMLSRGNGNKYFDGQAWEEGQVEEPLTLNTFYTPYVNMYQAAIGEYAFTEDFDTDSSNLNRMTAWVIFILMTFIVQVIMMNLIIGIVGKSYETVYHNSEPWIYKTRVEMSNKLKYLLDKSHKQEVDANGSYLMVIQKVDLKKEIQIVQND